MQVYENSVGSIYCQLEFDLINELCCVSVSLRVDSLVQSVRAVS